MAVEIKREDLLAKSAVLPSSQDSKGPLQEININANGFLQILQSIEKTVDTIKRTVDTVKDIAGMRNDKSAPIIYQKPVPLLEKSQPRIIEQKDEPKKETKVMPELDTKKVKELITDFIVNQSKELPKEYQDKPLKEFLGHEFLKKEFSMKKGLFKINTNGEELIELITMQICQKVKEMLK